MVEDLSARLVLLEALRESAPKGARGKKARHKVNRRIEAVRLERRLLLASLSGNYCRGSARGCHVVHMTADWIVGVDAFDPIEDFGIDPMDTVACASIPDISIDPDTRLLSVVNQASSARSFFISVDVEEEEGGDGFVICVDAEHAPMQCGLARDADGTLRPCVTLVLVVPPCSTMDVCYVRPGLTLPTDDGAGAGGSGPAVRVFSDIKDLPPGGMLPTPKELSDCQPGKEACPVYNCFPLAAAAAEDGDGRRKGFLCSQGMGGHFTHFYAGTLHAVDFECPVGTPVVAIADGQVVDVSQENTVGGIHARNLFLWNSVTLHLDDGHYAEYVHVMAGSARVAVGDRVAAGQVLCLSGDVGFCPTPHLHLQLHRSLDKDAATVKFAFAGGDDVADDSKAVNAGRPYIPIAGGIYHGT